MKKVLLAAAVALAPALYFTETAMAQTQQFGTEICVNASQAEQAKRLFPNARIHVLPDFPDPDMNGWRIVSGPVGPDGRIHTDAEEVRIRQGERGKDGVIRAANAWPWRVSKPGGGSESRHPVGEAPPYFPPID